MAANRTSFKKGQSGNPAGKPPGARHRVSRAIDELLDGEAEAITRKAIELAKNGESVALRLVLDRIVPPRRERPIQFKLPPIEKPEDLMRATGALLEAVANGELTPGEAAEIGRLIDVHVKAIEANDFEARIARLEAKP